MGAVDLKNLQPRSAREAGLEPASIGGCWNAVQAVSRIEEGAVLPSVSTLERLLGRPGRDHCCPAASSKLVRLATGAA